MTHKLYLRQLNLKTMCGRSDTLHIDLAKGGLLNTMAELTQDERGSSSVAGEEFRNEGIG